MIEVGIEADPALRPEPAAGRKVLFSAMKNEAPFLLEWVAYHKAIGFDEIVICSNPSSDGTEEVLAALAEAGEIRHLRADPPKEQSPQGVASRVFTDEVGYRDGDWYLWLDADEFLNIHVGDRTVDALINQLGERDLVLINWRLFGTSGNRSFPGRFVNAAFVGAAAAGFAANREQKTMFRVSNFVKGFAISGINRPILAGDPGLLAKKVMLGNSTASLDNTRANRAWLQGQDSSKTARVTEQEFGWDFAQINHYMVRTPEFQALKRLRGRGWMPDSAGKRNRRHTPGFFEDNDRNDEEDRTILHWDAAVTQEISRLMQLDGMAAAVSQSQVLVERAIAALDPTAGQADAPAPAEPAAHKAPVFALTLPDAEAAFLREAYGRAKAILEYGSGGSTVLAAELGKPVVSVESDKAWADRLSAHLAGITDKAAVHHVDIGPTKDWGRPRDSSGAARYHLYALSVWDREDLGEPDLVLIDGRFRAACLAAVLLRAKRPTTVLFDDYAPRPYYHGVEKLALKEEMVGRMARFTVTPGPIPPEMLTQVIGWFSDPR